MNQNRRRIKLGGRLQGLGLRPLVWRIATALGLTGSVRNQVGGVCIEVQGAILGIDQFVANLHEQLPASGRIDWEQIDEIPIEYGTEGCSVGFAIHSSQGQGFTLCDALPDIAPCEDCLSEIFDPASRRYHYLMNSCTQCGPRYSIQTGTPFDRGRTTLDVFPLCADCQREYTDPANRRFHAQTIGCFECGPTWVWRERHAQEIDCTSPPNVESMLDRCEQILRTDGIVLVKSVGGYQFLCDAASQQATLRIRKIKNREHKPFAVLVESLAHALEMVELSREAQVALQESHRPIVVASRKPANGVSQDSLGRWISELENSLGVMLPNSPVQCLLARRIGRPMVVTSANLSSEPMLIDDQQALDRFGDQVDAILMHNRRIAEPLDDPVVCDAQVGVIPIRLGRGDTPCRLSTDQTQFGSNCGIALGADLKAAWGMSLGQGLYLMQHLGDASHPAVITRIEDSIQKLLQSDLPAASVLIDMHPAYETTMLGKRLAGNDSDGSQRIGCQSIQHHAAHLGALGVDAGIPSEEPLVGFVFDGTGYGSDGTIWGGELIGLRRSEFSRLGYLRPFRLPCGDVAAKYPWRTALALLVDAGLGIEDLQACCDWTEHSPWGSLLEAQRSALVRVFDSPTLSIPTSSIGRFLDGLASLLGLVHCNGYEGHAAMTLEDLAMGHSQERGDTKYAFVLQNQGGAIEFDGRPVVRGVVEDLRSGIDRARIAFGIHAAIATMMSDALVHLTDDSKQSHQVGLSGGVFQNRLLVELAVEAMSRAGHQVYLHRRVPPNDSGLAIGQLRLARSVRSV
jgi:hydrogenase maturation protein HypF